VRIMDREKKGRVRGVRQAYKCRIQTLQGKQTPGKDLGRAVCCLTSFVERPATQRRESTETRGWEG